MCNPSTEQLKCVMHQKGYQVFTRPFELNLIGIRSDETSQYRFEESLAVLFHDDFQDTLVAHFACTTKMNVLGNAPIKQGQYIGEFERRKVKSKDYALCKKGVNSLIDWQSMSCLEPKTQAVQLKGIETIDGSCVVLKSHSHILCTLLDLSIRYYGNSFSFTLLNERDFQ